MKPNQLQLKLFS